MGHVFGTIVVIICYLLFVDRCPNCGSHKVNKKGNGITASFKCSRCDNFWMRS